MDAAVIYTVSGPAIANYISHDQSLLHGPSCTSAREEKYPNYFLPLSHRATGLGYPDRFCAVRLTATAHRSVASEKCFQSAPLFTVSFSDFGVKSPVRHTLVQRDLVRRNRRSVKTAADRGT